jgi:hypothetical protein
MPLSTLFQLYHGGRFYCWEETPCGGYGGQGYYIYLETSSGNTGDKAELRSNVAFDGKIMNYVNGKFHVVIDRV